MVLLRWGSVHLKVQLKILVLFTDIPFMNDIFNVILVKLISFAWKKCIVLVFFHLLRHTNLRTYRYAYLRHIKYPYVVAWAKLQICRSRDAYVIFSISYILILWLLHQTWMQNCRQDHKGNSAWPAWIKLSTDICIMTKIKIYYVLGGLTCTIAHEIVKLLSMMLFVHYHW